LRCNLNFNAKFERGNKMKEINDMLKKETVI